MAPDRGPRTTAVRPFDQATAPRAAAVGAAAGAGATLAMSMVMLPARWLGLLGTQPPRRISDRLIAEAGSGNSTPEPVRRVGTALVHLATGAASGAVFGLARVATRGAGSPSVVGPAFGAGVWGAAYVVAAPALELFAPPWKDRPARPQVMFVAHLVYGFVTAALFDLAIGSARSNAVDTPEPHRFISLFGAPS
jgi:hypothetical protein